MDINKSVISRLFGHTPKTQTGAFGAVGMETMRRGLEQLIWDQININLH